MVRREGKEEEERKRIRRGRGEEERGLIEEHRVREKRWRGVRGQGNERQ